MVGGRPIAAPYFTLSVHGGYLACHSIPLGKYIDDLAVHTECEDRLGWQILIMSIGTCWMG